MLETVIGKNILLWLSGEVDKTAVFANEGISFLFGPMLADGEVFVIEVLGIIFFLSTYCCTIIFWYHEMDSRYPWEELSYFSVMYLINY